MKLTEWTMEEQEQLIHFMTTNSWPFHGHEHPVRALIEKTIEEGGYKSDQVTTFWIENEENQQVGLVKIFDLQDDIPLFDLRIADPYRSKGYGPKALKMVADFVFSLPEKKIRLEGNTRHDNFAMRKAFERTGFVKEAHLRQAWFSPRENRYYDAVIYGMTREDWQAGITTPVLWDDAVIETKEPPFNPVLLDFPEEFESERLLIRAPRREDAKASYEAVMHSLEAFRPWLPFAQQKPDLSETEATLIEAAANFKLRKDLRLHFFLKETGQFIGSTGLHRIDWEVRKFEIGYWIDSRFEGKGFATEAVERITRFAFEELGANRVEIRCDPDNVRSRAVANRLHFELEGTLRNDAVSRVGNKLRDTCVYAKIRQ
ncbi:ribosomal protein N-acetyltransferase [Planococcus antarcticus DSM 14505]|uniref:GNAT family N-acetyltransferase n=1 Tax=Planococcus antarcticus DSM 14505 TaxID=1185653 RepID=A0A1C7DLK6_9BACL|nr:GNAT family N-acetyltransferase [Planococcus antarcticus]ANU12103.1 GNAT family N-acetyltransferase [Planococcus antarcticus DSM 14505]EIM06441.1 ribosomal protein N-acetyltransferase [Planococcus antarcticus DSM 14505]